VIKRLGTAVIFLMLTGLSFPAVYSSAATTGPNWVSLQRIALSEIQSIRGNGQVIEVSGPSASTPGTSPSSSDQSIRELEKTLVVRDGGGTLIAGLDVLGAEQLVVSFIQPGTSTGTVVVFEPGSNSVNQIITTTVSTPSGTTNSEGEGAVPLINGCTDYLENPYVEGSIYGELMVATAYIYNCTSSTSLAIIAALYEWGGPQLSEQGNSTVGTALVVNAYYPCSGIWFVNSAGLYSQNGVEQPGKSSGEAFFNC
jgi:hypothetical protein